MTDKEYFQNWENSLSNHGYKSEVPVSEYFSRDLTEAWIMIDFWIREGVIVKIC